MTILNLNDSLLYAIKYSHEYELFIKDLVDPQISLLQLLPFSFEWT